MSRIGKKPITIPQGTEVSVLDGVVTVKGPKGELARPLHTSITVSQEGDIVSVLPVDQTKESSALWGTFASHITNMVAGVNTPFEKKLIIEGVGYRAEVQGSKLVMNLGFSHPVEMEIPEGLTVTVEKNNASIVGINKELVGSFASKIRLKRKPEPYKGKGIRYHDEIIRRKQGKKTV
jgi:large subunit ribosomal protein L6